MATRLRLTARCIRWTLFKYKTNIFQIYGELFEMHAKQNCYTRWTCSYTQWIFFPMHGEHFCSIWRTFFNIIIFWKVNKIRISNFYWFWHRVTRPTQSPVSSGILLRFHFTHSMHVMVDAFPLDQHPPSLLYILELHRLDARARLDARTSH